jgi:hypothetical protein
MAGDHHCLFGAKTERERERQVRDGDGMEGFL